MRNSDTDANRWSTPTTYSYTAGHVTSVTNDNDETVSYLYNPAGQVACIAYPVAVTTGCGSVSSPATGSSSNTVVTRTYNSSGTLQSLSDWLGNTVTYSFADPLWVPRFLYGRDRSNLNNPTSVEHCVIRRRSLNLGQKSWPHYRRPHLSTRVAPYCSINRYYDSATDQFLSVDPDVAETDQPYVFTNDDPLNAEDPLGLQGSNGAQAIAAQEKAAAANKAYCAKHPDALGHNCGGLLHEVAGTIAKAASRTNEAVSDVPGATEISSALPTPSCVVKAVLGGNYANSTKKAWIPGIKYLLGKLGITAIDDTPIGWVYTGVVAIGSCAIPGFPKP